MTPDTIPAARRLHSADRPAQAVPDPFLDTPPHDLPAERSVLGGMLLSKDAIGDVVEVLRASDFYRPAHATVYETIGDLYGRGEPADIVSVTAELGRRGTLERVGGPAYMHTLISSVPTAANAGYYARIVAEKALFRRIAEAGTRIVQIGQAAAGTGADASDRADALLHAAISAIDSGAGPTALGSTLASTLDRLEALERGEADETGVSTGFLDLDQLTNGFQPGQMIVIAARPGVGKSTLALDFARHAAIKHKRPALFVSLEMSRAELDQRILSAEARVPLADIRNGKIGKGWERISGAMGRMAEAPLHIDTSPNVTMSMIRTRARRMQRRHGLDLLVLDYLQLMSTPKSSESRQQAVSEISRSLKLLAAELGVPVIALSQLNRASEQRADKRPQLSDLRESGAIEQDADMVILIHRDDLVDESSRPGEADLIIAKHRNGPTGTVTVAFQGHFSRFVDMAN